MRHKTKWILGITNAIIAGWWLAELTHAQEPYSFSVVFLVIHGISSTVLIWQATEGIGSK